MQIDEPKIPASETQPAQFTSEAIGMKVAENPNSPDQAAPKSPQNTAKPAEKPEAMTDDDAVKGSDNPMFVDFKEDFTNKSTASVNGSEMIPNRAPLPPANHNEASLSSQPGASTKVEAGKQPLKSKPALSMDDEILPAEKQSRSSQALQPAANPVGPEKETMSVGYNGKTPVDPVDAQATEIAQQVIRQMNVKIKNGPTSMHLQLNPKELGNIDVEMVSTSQGVRVTFFTEQANTSKLLETQLSQLRESLIDSGVQLSGLNISQHNLSEQKGGFFSQDKNFTQSPQGDTTRSEPKPTETSPAGRNLGASGEVDYRI